MQSYIHMRCQARQLDSYSTARHCSTARQLDRTRQTSTDLSTDLDTPAHAVSLDLPRWARQLLDSYSTATRHLLDRLDRQGLDSTSTTDSGLDSGSTEPRQLDSSTASGSTKRATGRPVRTARSKFTQRPELVTEGVTVMRKPGNPKRRLM